MKLQSLAVIFVIIILPVTLVISEYIQLQLNSVVLMSQFDAKLNDATYDAIRAYQLNEQNATTEKIGNEKIRDIEASINTFFASLANSLGIDGYTEEDLKPYVPAMVYTLYNGYYIYGPYYKRNPPNDVNELESELSYGLKPFIAYSEMYTEGSNSVVINYTLDNYITIYGTINGTPIHKGGYIIDPNSIISDSGTSMTVSTPSGNVIIKEEKLAENSGFDVSNKTSQETPYVNERPYKYFNQRDKKNIHYDEGTIRSRQKIILGDIDGGLAWLQKNINKTYSKYTYIDKSLYTNSAETNEIDNTTNEIYDDSALLYYKSAKEFTEYVRSKLSWIKPANAKNIAGVTYTNTGSIFDNLDNVENEYSAFNQHRKEVIRKSIESNLRSSIEAYNGTSTELFKMPKLTENDWEKILNNVSVISFLQNVIIKNNYQRYSGYAVLTNNQNKDYTDPTQIYIETENDKLVHRASCKKLIQPLGEIKAYKNIDYLRQNVFNNTGVPLYYYKHYNTLCYDCLINAEVSDGRKKIEKILEENPNTNVKNAYYMALAREKYNTNMPYKYWYDKYNPTPP